MSPSLKKLLYFPVTKIIIGIAVCFVILVGVQNFIIKPIFYKIIPGKAIADTIRNYISVGVLLLSYLYLFRFYEKRKISELSVKQLPGEFIGGFMLGFSILSIVVLILYFLGHYRVIEISNYSYLLAPFSFLVIATLFEEVFFRLIIYRILENWLGTYLALFLICIIFTIPHLFNDHVSILAVFTILTFSFATSIMYNYTKRLWLPFAFHLGWNFALPFYGSNLSGIEDAGSIIKATFKGPVLLIGSQFGIEDSILSAIFLTILSVAFLYFSIKEKKILTGSIRYNNSKKQ
jgi:membrane protease YdiL (CAAX protease family)